MNLNLHFKVNACLHERPRKARNAIMAICVGLRCKPAYLLLLKPAAVATILFDGVFKRSKAKAEEISLGLAGRKNLIRLLLHSTVADQDCIMWFCSSTTNFRLVHQAFQRFA